ncbi:putative F-box/LRR-repeat protein 23 [Hibiscus syriacus]|uniref:F-box/LRR-repeat protein 23 n=1 Tax=Hibiscus syriacus TaxID=106335 RepID=A0A6A2X5X1_HIBSY|nr:putative F-box/LRR-repeat protein 23 [Hibiscus syriacus]KAE8670623.1 putative F-box/LRR-repeat protein 23 [Hibiscus syriacus]
MSDAADARNWLELPPDVTASILSRLGAIEILSSAQDVCSQWRKICKDPSMWRSIDMRNLGEWDKDYVHEKMCFHAVDHSCGHLLDINIEYFGTDDLLLYIAERSVHLKRLRLFSCFGISDEGLSKAALKLPFLEELEIFIGPISKHAVETIGRSCPHLKSFKYNLQRCKGYVCDDEALAIAQTMPELRHLQLLGNGLTNEGLQAILDGCPHLEYLDLRQCFSVRLVGNLEKRCVERIKNLRHPSDPTHDFKFVTEDLDTWYNPSDYDDYDEYD